MYQAGSVMSMFAAKKIVKELGKAKPGADVSELLSAKVHPLLAKLSSYEWQQIALALDPNEQAKSAAWGETESLAA